MGVEDRRAWNGFGRALVVSCALCLAIGVAATAAVDPYWVFRTQPPWLAWTGGVNRLLDVDMRRAKPLQLFSRPAETVLIGSSTVYPGLPPADTAGGPPPPPPPPPPPAGRAAAPPRPPPGRRR